MLGARFKNVGNRMEWGFGGVYGPIGKGLKESFWEELGDGLGRWDIPWVLGGDFKHIRFLEEIMRGKVISRAV